MDKLDRQAIEDAHDLEITQWASWCVKELRRRALLSKSYHTLAEAVTKNAARNAATRAAGLDVDTE